MFCFFLKVWNVNFITQLQIWYTAIIYVELMVIFYFPRFSFTILEKLFILILFVYLFMHSLPFIHSLIIYCCNIFMLHGKWLQNLAFKRTYLLAHSSVVRTVARHDWILWPRNDKDEIKVSTRLNSLEAWEAKRKYASKLIICS